MPYIPYGCLQPSGTVSYTHLFSRINVKIKSDEETELNGQGPEITAKAIDLLFTKLNSLKAGDTLVLAGSIPSSLPSDIYERIMARLCDRGIRFVVDATKDLLLNVLKYKPFLIKPNNLDVYKRQPLSCRYFQALP